MERVAENGGKKGSNWILVESKTMHIILSKDITRTQAIFYFLPFFKDQRKKSNTNRLQGDKKCMYIKRSCWSVQNVSNDKTEVISWIYLLSTWLGIRVSST